jgi:hypothetical protein
MSDVTKENAPSGSSWLKWWPVFIAGFCGPLIGRLLSRWLPAHFAMGIGFFVPWVLAWLICSDRLSPRWGLPPWLAAVLAGAGGGIVAGLFYFLFP